MKSGIKNDKTLKSLAVANFIKKLVTGFEPATY